jgi:hypothetical protein
MAASAPAKANAVDEAQRQAEPAWRQRADRGPAGDAQHVGIGQRVAQQHLHQRAGQRQQAAAGEGGQRARQAQAADHFDRQPVASPNSAPTTSPARPAGCPPPAPRAGSAQPEQGGSRITSRARRRVGMAVG